MKNRTNIIAATILISLALSTSFAQVTYTWVGGSSANFTTASSWSPTRLNGQVSDILCINCGGTVNANNVQQQTIGQLLITNNTHVIFTPASGNPKVISINGGTGDDFVLESGSTFEINGTTPQLGIFVKVGATASISGIIALSGNAAHYLNANDANSFVFHSGSSLTQNTPGYIFTGAGTVNAVVFENGSTFTVNHSLASNPFGLAAPNAKVVFNQNSTYVLRTADTSALSINGRTYGNVVLDYSASMQINEAMTSNTSFNNITLNAGSNLSLNNTNSSYSSILTINGNLNGPGSLTVGNNNLNNLNLRFNGAFSQTNSSNGKYSLNNTHNQNTVNKKVSNNPSSFGISQNYPNPFNPTTKIDYTLPATSKVTIKLFDITGKEVSVLVNSTQDAGNYTIQVSSNKLASGIYFYNITATSENNHFEQTVKMIVAK